MCKFPRREDVHQQGNEELRWNTQRLLTTTFSGGDNCAVDVSSLRREWDEARSSAGAKKAFADKYSLKGAWKWRSTYLMMVDVLWLITSWL